MYIDLFSTRSMTKLITKFQGTETLLEITHVSEKDFDKNCILYSKYTHAVMLYTSTVL